MQNNMHLNLNIIMYGSCVRKSVDNVIKVKKKKKIKKEQKNDDININCDNIIILYMDVMSER